MGTTPWGLLVQPEMGAVIMVVRDELLEESLEMSLIQGDDLIEQLAPAAADPALRDSILPRALDGGSHADHLHGLNRSRDRQSILCVVIQDEELGRGLIRKCFAQLLDDPTASRMLSHIEMQDASTVVADDEEAIKQVKGERRDSEEIPC
jgi:hypothetical protein